MLLDRSGKRASSRRSRRSRLGAREGAADGPSALGVEGHLERAIALASEQLAQRGGNRRIVAISDAGGLADALPADRLPLSVVQSGRARRQRGHRPHRRRSRPEAAAAKEPTA